MTEAGNEYTWSYRQDPVTGLWEIVDPDGKVRARSEAEADAHTLVAMLSRQSYESEASAEDVASG